MKRRRKTDAAGNLTAISLVAMHWSLDDPWQPGFDVEFKSSGGGSKPAERLRRIHYPGPTWLDSLIILLDEALPKNP